MAGAGDTEDMVASEMSHAPRQDGILFGMVGAYDWEGGVLEFGRRGRLVPARGAFQEEFPAELRNHAAYLGTDHPKG